MDVAMRHARRCTEIRRVERLTADRALRTVEEWAEVLECFRAGTARLAKAFRVGCSAEFAGQRFDPPDVY
jgi:hypothetical protein